MVEYTKPLPSIDESEKPFWGAAKRHELVMQRCLNCGRSRYPLAELCPACLSSQVEWARVSGRGKVYSWIVYHRAFHPAFAQDVPYAVALIELEEGPRLFSNIVGGKLEDLRIGMPVEVTFEDVTPEVSLPRFKPVG